MSKATAAAKSRLRALPPPEALAGLPEAPEWLHEACSQLLLCSMRWSHTADGFYTVVSAVPLRAADSA